MVAKRIIISRTDNIGDVVLTFPLCRWLREHYPESELIYLCKRYTKPVVQCFGMINQILCWEDIESMPSAEQVRVVKELQADVFLHVFPRKEIAALAKKARIPIRIGTSHRVFHLLTCTHRLNFTRKKSPLHEAQLNFHLLEPLGSKQIPDWDEIQGMSESFTFHTLTSRRSDLPIVTDKTILLHPGSKGSAVEWPIDAYSSLAKSLKEKGFAVFFTGTEEEGAGFRSMIPWQDGIADLTGKLSLEELLETISLSYGLIACSTGPLHLAGIMGKRTIGLFSPRVPIHPGRWKPLGKNAKTIVFDVNCQLCKKGKICNCVHLISPDEVLKQFLINE